MRAGDRVAVAVSGGADSVALLRVLLDLRAELGVVLAVAHFNHGLRGEQSDADEAFVAELAHHHRLEFFIGQADVREHARTNKLTIEAAARRLRYEWLVALAHQERFDCIATAHTRNDQAETVLLKFLRGAGTRGLAGIYPSVLPREQEEVRIIRPLLCVSRCEGEKYLVALDQSWREDETNLDRRFLRNRVRHELLPLLERDYNPKIRQLLSDLAEVSRGEEQYWNEIIERHLADHVSLGRLSLRGFAELPLALQRRLLKCLAESDGPALDFPHVEQLRCCALGDMFRVELPGGRMAVRTDGFLELCTPQSQASRAYSYILAVPGEIKIVELELTVVALVVPEAFAREAAAGTLLKKELIGTELTVRNWTPGDRFHAAHHRSEEKLKRLFAEEHIPAAERPTWPVALHEDEIIWVRGMPVASAYQWKGDGEAVKIEAIAH